MFQSEGERKLQRNRTDRVFLSNNNININDNHVENNFCENPSRDYCSYCKTINTTMGMQYKMEDLTSCFYGWSVYNNKIIILINRVNVCEYKSTCSSYIWLRRQYPNKHIYIHTHNNRWHSKNLY